MSRAFQTYIERLEHAATEHELCDALATVIGNYDLSSFAYIVLPCAKGTPPRLITNYPLRWTRHYIANNYQCLDPVLSQSCILRDPFDWQPGFANDNDATRHFFCEASEFGIGVGRTIPIHNRRGPVAAVTFVSDRRYAAFRACMARNADTLELIVLYFHAYVCRKLGIVPNVHLTTCERQCLFWISLGKSARDTGEIMGSSERTVKFHLQNIRAKFNVATTIQAAIAYERVLNGRDV